MVSFFRYRKKFRFIFELDMLIDVKVRVLVDKGFGKIKVWGIFYLWFFYFYTKFIYLMWFFKEDNFYEFVLFLRVRINYF